MPPYILEALSKHAPSDATRAGALETLELTGRLRVQRMAPVHNLETLAQQPGDRRTVCDVRHDGFLPGAIVRREGEAPVADAAVNEAYDNAGVTYDFFERVFGRRSIDGKDMRLLSSVHYSKQYDNAFWDGKQMVYGDAERVTISVLETSSPLKVSGFPNHSRACDRRNSETESRRMWASALLAIRAEQISASAKVVAKTSISVGQEETSRKVAIRPL